MIDSIDVYADAPGESGGNLDLKTNAKIRRRLADDLERRIVVGGDYEDFDRGVVAKLREDADAMELKATRKALIDPKSRPVSGRVSR